MTLAVNFRLPPEDALKFFRGKGLVTSFSWQDLLHQEHDVGFTVAKLTDLDLLADVKDAVDRAISGEVSWQQFRDELEPLLKSRGWWGAVEVTDPTTGEIATTVFDARRLRLIYDTNIRTAYATGHWAKIAKNAASAPYVMYVAVHDDRTRPQHLAWDGTVLRWDDAWWQTHTPPNGWNCRCSVIQLSGRDLKKLGKDGPDTPPDDGVKQWTNPRTGEVIAVPNGIDPGWGYAPGKSRLANLAGAALDKIAAAPADLGAAASEALATTIGGPASELFAAWVDQVRARGVSAGQRQVVGALSTTEIDFLQEKGIEPLSAGILLQDSLLLAKQARHERAGNALTDDELKRLPEMLLMPEAVLYDKVHENLTFVSPAADDRSIKIIVEVNYARKGEVFNNVASTFKVNTYNLRDGNVYQVVRGEV